ncbi:alpha/beta hydrolase [Novosphingobium terrae]|uniref:alpha/beta hydrolase n=1 Tax=Novosphingobium terrae TaxID=2726189 RepID=UPI00197F4E12|nr:alpha/beta hydrolase [Novosphingobium terrae]
MPKAPFRRAACALALMLVGASPAQAQREAQQGMPKMEPAAAPAEPDAIPLYGQATPGSAASEVWSKAGGVDYTVRNVTRPTLTPVLPDPAKATGAAVVVAPGGAFMLLAMDHEGWGVAHALAAKGIAAFVLKYRLLPTPGDEGEAGAYMMHKMMAGLPDPTRQPTLTDPEAAADGREAIKLVRANAARWGVDPARVGMIGFSAGAMTALQTVLTARPGEKPAFFGYIYGPQPRVDVPADAPPMFDALALDDPLFPSQGFPIAQGWLAARRPVEIHGYQQGSHGFGLGVPGTTTTLVMDEFVAWMAMQGMLTRR